MASSSPSHSSSSSPVPAAGSAGGGGAAPSLLPPPLPTATSSRRIPPPCWTHEETLALIDSYRDKWYSLRRSNLRATHWEEVADAVSHRCHGLPAATPKTSVQCRHKVEKLRKRYRSEKQRSALSSWTYFTKMDAMERGGGGAAAAKAGATPSRPSPSPSPVPPLASDDEDEDDDDNYPVGRGGGGGGSGSTTRSLHHLMGNGGGGIAGLKFRIPKGARSSVVSRAEEMALARRPGGNSGQNGRPFLGFAGSKAGAEEMRRRLEKRRKTRREREGEAVGEMVRALRTLGDGFMRMEQMKMDMAREMEKARMEMELKRTEMMIDCQRRMVDSLVDGSTKKKKAKVSPDS